jgi:hypothetical protein
MKTIFTLFVALISLSAFAQIQVEGKTINVNGSHDGFFITIPYGNKKMIEKELKDELKSWKGSYKDKDFIFVDDCKLKEMGKNTFDVYAKVEDITEGGATVSIAIDLGGAFLNASEHGAQYKIIEKKLYVFGVKAAKNVVAEDVKAEEKILKDREKELEDLQKAKEESEKEIVDYQDRIKKEEENIKKNETDQSDKEIEITTQKEKVQEVIKKKEAIK